MLIDDVNFTELNLEIARFNRLVQSSGFTFKNDATALDVLQWLSQCFLTRAKRPNLNNFVAVSTKPQKRTA